MKVHPSTVQKGIELFTNHSLEMAPVARVHECMLRITSYPLGLIEGIFEGVAIIDDKTVGR